MEILQSSDLIEFYWQYPEKANAKRVTRNKNELRKVQTVMMYESKKLLQSQKELSFLCFFSLGLRLKK